MIDCTDCRYQENMCEWPCNDCVKGDKWEEKPFTNADRIRAMTDEELATYLIVDIECEVARRAGWRIPMNERIEMVDKTLDWLKQEAEG